MNSTDKANLEFLLSTSPEGLAAWYTQATAIDLAYTDQLLTAAKIDMEMQLVEAEDDVEDLSDAQQILARFRI